MALHNQNYSSSSALISARREMVLQAYNSAMAENHFRFLNGDDKATKEYIFPNQMEDAMGIVDKFYKIKCRVISIQKKTKVGADGLMIEIAKLLTTHIDDEFVLDPDNIRIITGMSNAGWEKDMIDKAPNCFKKNIFHHGKLQRADIMNLKNGIIIIDEIDTGDKEYQVLHNTLKDAGVLDVEHMNTLNNRFVFISATMIKELYDLYRWGDLHHLCKMTIPTSYFGHKDFLDNGIVKEFYSLHTPKNAEDWVQNDILDNYKNDYRIHIVRVNTKTLDIILKECNKHKNIVLKNHTSTNRVSDETMQEIFKEPLKTHIVLCVKGFFRRANLIPNSWKLRIGATHELYTKVVDNNVQIQGLTGRMTGYWRDDIVNGHKTGPHRTSIRAIQQYENTYNDPFGTNSYQTNGFKKNKGKVSSKPTLLSTKHIKNIEAVELPLVQDEKVDINSYRIYANEDIVKSVCTILGYTYLPTKDNKDGFKETSLNQKKSVVSLKNAVKKVPTAYGTTNGVLSYRTYYPCYEDTSDKTSLRFVVILRPETAEHKIKECDKKYKNAHE